MYMNTCKWRDKLVCLILKSEVKDMILKFLWFLHVLILPSVKKMVNETMTYNEMKCVIH